MERKFRGGGCSLFKTGLVLTLPLGDVESRSSVKRFQESYKTLSLQAKLLTCLGVAFSAFWLSLPQAPAFCLPTQGALE